MGNTILRAMPDHSEGGPAAPAANGVLARIPGNLISKASEQLPPAAQDQEASGDRAVSLHGVPGLGDVLITFRLNSYRHRRSRFWHWVAVRADFAR